MSRRAFNPGSKHKLARRALIGPVQMLAQVNNIGLPEVQGVYRITCKPLKKVYIGSASDLGARWVEHQSHLWAGTHDNRNLQAAFDHYGPAAFTFDVLETIPGRKDPEARYLAEQRWMDRHPQRFNVRPAGSDEYLQKTKAGRAAVQAALQEGRVPKFCKQTGRLAPTKGCTCFACKFHRRLKGKDR